MKPNKSVEVISKIRGVRVTNHYHVGSKHIVQFAVKDNTALRRMCNLSELINAPLQIYMQSSTEFRYTLFINRRSKEILLAHYALDTAK